MGVTAKDIAQVCGLSVPTVTHVLGSQGHRYRPETRRLILKAARKMGYRPNTSARAMRTGKFDCVALLMSSEPQRSLLRGEALDGICRGLESHNMHLSLTRLADEALLAKGGLPKILRESMADGLLLNYNQFIPPELVRTVEAQALPSVWMRSKQRQDCVYIDYGDGARRATTRLLELGHLRIAWVNYSYGMSYPPGTHHGAIDGEAGYREAMRDAGLQPQVIREAKSVPRVERPERFAALLGKPDRPTAFLTLGASTALPLIYAAARQGLAVPEDLSIITFGLLLEDQGGTAVATVLIPEKDLGYAAAEMLVQKIRTPDLSHPPLVLPCGFVDGSTCGAVPRR